VLDVLERALEEWESTSDGEWLARYAPLLDDLRAALEWAVAEPHLAVAIAGASWPLWRELSLRSEGRRRLGVVLALLPAGAPVSHEARLRLGLGYLWLNTAEVRASHSEFARAAELYRSRGERVSLGSALAGIAFAGLLLGKTEESLESIREALYLLENGACLRTIAIAHSNELCIEASLGNLAAARAAGEKSLRFSEAIGADRLFYTTTGNLIELLLQAGDFDGAIAGTRNVLPLLRRTSHYELLGFTLGLLSAALTARGDLAEALDTARDAAPLLRDQGWLSWFLDHLALRAAAEDRMKDAARIAGYADADYRKLGRSREPIALQAVDRLHALLRAALPEVEILQLRREGSLLTEQQALALALPPPAGKLVILPGKDG
jgi:tetratricopeptide (TPR) repeat protein